MSYIDKMKSSKKESIPALAVELMDAATKFHVLHLTVTGAGSYAAHKALNNLYDALPGLADAVAEGYQGATGTIPDYPDNISAPTMRSVKDAINYIDQLHTKITRVQDGCEFSEIVNDLDNIKSTLNSAKYKLKFLS
jgi:DNA-binding ferritin-like protein